MSEKHPQLFYLREFLKFSEKNLGEKEGVELKEMLAEISETVNRLPDKFRAQIEPEISMLQEGGVDIEEIKDKIASVLAKMEDLKSDVESVEDTSGVYESSKKEILESEKDLVDGVLASADESIFDSLKGEGFNPSKQEFANRELSTGFSDIVEGVFGDEELKKLLAEDDLEEAIYYVREKKSKKGKELFDVEIKYKFLLRQEIKQPNEYPGDEERDRLLAKYKKVVVENAIYSKILQDIIEKDKERRVEPEMVKEIRGEMEGEEDQIAQSFEGKAREFFSKMGAGSFDNSLYKDLKEIKKGINVLIENILQYDSVSDSNYKTLERGGLEIVKQGLEKRKKAAEDLLYGSGKNHGEFGELERSAKKGDLTRQGAEVVENTFRRCGEDLLLIEVYDKLLKIVEEKIQQRQKDGVAGEGDTLVSDESIPSPGESVGPPQKPPVPEVAVPEEVVDPQAGETQNVEKEDSLDELGFFVAEFSKLEERVSGLDKIKLKKDLKKELKNILQDVQELAQGDMEGLDEKVGILKQIVKEFVGKNTKTEDKLSLGDVIVSFKKTMSDIKEDYSVFLQEATKRTEINKELLERIPVLAGKDIKVGQKLWFNDPKGESVEVTFDGIKNPEKVPSYYFVTTSGGSVDEYVISVSDWDGNGKEKQFSWEKPTAKKIEKVPDTRSGTVETDKTELWEKFKVGDHQVGVGDKFIFAKDSEDPRKCEVTGVSDMLGEIVLKFKYNVGEGFSIMEKDWDKKLTSGDLKLNTDSMPVEKLAEPIAPVEPPVTVGSDSAPAELVGIDIPSADEGEGVVEFTREYEIAGRKVEQEDIFFYDENKGSGKKKEIQLVLVGEKPVKNKNGKGTHRELVFEDGSGALRLLSEGEFEKVGKYFRYGGNVEGDSADSSVVGEEDKLVEPVAPVEPVEPKPKPVEPVAPVEPVEPKPKPVEPVASVEPVAEPVVDKEPAVDNNGILKNLRNQWHEANKTYLDKEQEKFDYLANLELSKADQKKVKKYMKSGGEWPLDETKKEKEINAELVVLNEKRVTLAQQIRETKKKIETENKVVTREGKVKKDNFYQQKAESSTTKKNPKVTTSTSAGSAKEKANFRTRLKDNVAGKVSGVVDKIDKPRVGVDPGDSEALDPRTMRPSFYEGEADDENIVDEDEEPVVVDKVEVKKAKAEAKRKEKVEKAEEKKKKKDEKVEAKRLKKEAKEMLNPGFLTGLRDRTAGKKKKIAMGAVGLGMLSLSDNAKPGEQAVPPSDKTEQVNAVGDTGNAKPEELDARVPEKKALEALDELKSKVDFYLKITQRVEKSGSGSNKIIVSLQEELNKMNKHIIDNEGKLLKNPNLLKSYEDGIMLSDLRAALSLDQDEELLLGLGGVGEITLPKGEVVQVNGGNSIIIFKDGGKTLVFHHDSKHSFFEENGQLMVEVGDKKYPAEIKLSGKKVKVTATAG